MEHIDQNIMDKSQRSVFVGNIPYDVSEDRLREIFNEVGVILSFKLVYDRETGKPKGYGFCEYRDQETALSAMRNLNGYEINGRTIRVDNACTEKSRMEMQSLLQSQVIESPYGPPCDSEKAPEIISQMVASMSPEALFDLIKQIKISIQNNPEETKAMLTSNPQMTYAVLQGLVVLKLIDVDNACAMLYKKNGIPPVLQPLDPMQQMARQMMPPVVMPGVPILQPPPPPPPSIQLLQQNAQHQPLLPTSITSALQRPVDQDLRVNREINTVGQMQPTGVPPIPISQVPLPPTPSPQNDMFNREQRIVPPTPSFAIDPRSRANPERQTPVSVPTAPTTSVSKPSNVKQEQRSPTLTTEATSTTTSTSGPSTDEEKAALIMQVLQLSEDQIAMLPVDQRKSILALREQIAKSTSYNNS